MTAPNLTDHDTDTIGELADGLAIAFLRLHRAAAIDRHLAGADPDYQGRSSWNVALAIHAAIAAVEATVNSCDLAREYTFWQQPAEVAAVAAANAQATAPPSTDLAADRLVNHLGAALNALLGAWQHTSDSGVDDAIEAVCAALQAATTRADMDIDSSWDMNQTAN